jgi:hypothetical protein
LMCWYQKWFLKNKKTSLACISARKAIWKATTTTLPNTLLFRTTETHAIVAMERSKVDPWITQFMFAVISAIRADTKTLDRDKFWQRQAVCNVILSLLTAFISICLEHGSASKILCFQFQSSCVSGLHLSSVAMSIA